MLEQANQSMSTLQDQATSGGGEIKIFHERSNSIDSINGETMIMTDFKMPGANEKIKRAKK